MTRTSRTRTRMHAAAIVATVVAIPLGIAACGGGHGSDAGGASMAAASDPFFAVALSVSATSSDDALPISIDALAPTAPDDAEPTPLG